MRPMAGRAMSEMNYLIYLILRVFFFNGGRLTFLLENVIEDRFKLLFHILQHFFQLPVSRPQGF